MDIWKSIAGILEVELTSAELGAAFHAITEKNISMFQVNQVSDLTARFQIYRRDFRNLNALCKKRGEILSVCHRKGIYWSIKSVLRRPILLMCIILLLSIGLYLPTRVLFIRVEGNSSVPSNKILAAAEQSGICLGASRQEVRSEKMKNTLLAAVPELQWAGVNTTGCVATISVRERTDPEIEEEENYVSSIVAARDGVIYSCTVTRGNKLCSVGQAVKEGQVLVSGYTDCGISIQATRAEGEIYAQTNRNLTAVTLSECVKRTQIVDSEKKYSLLIGKKRINLWKGSGIWDSSCGRMYKEIYLTLPGGFQLPIALIVEEFKAYETEVYEIPEAVTSKSLSKFSGNYLSEQMVAGNILSKTEVTTMEAGVYRIDGQYVCAEMIGRVQREQIGE